MSGYCVAVDDHLTDKDVAGAVADQMGSPIAKPGGGSFDHTKEVSEAMKGVEKNTEILKNVDNPAAQEAVQKGQNALDNVREAVQGAGI